METEETFDGKTVLRTFDGEKTVLSFNGELPLGEGLQPPGLLLRLEALLEGGEGLADGAGLLGAQVQGDVLLALEKQLTVSR